MAREEKNHAVVDLGLVEELPRRDDLLASRFAVDDGARVDLTIGDRGVLLELAGTRRSGCRHALRPEQRHAVRVDLHKSHRRAVLGGLDLERKLALIREPQPAHPHGGQIMTPTAAHPPRFWKENEGTSFSEIILAGQRRREAITNQRD